MAESEEKKLNEEELISTFDNFWSKDGERLPVSEWKNLETKEAKTVISVLKSGQEPGPKLRNSSSYNKCKDKWEKSGEKAAEGEEDFQHDESRVDWAAINKPDGVAFFVGIRNWPTWMLSETNRHTRGYVVSTFDNHPVKGVSIIMKKADKMLGIIKKEKEEESKEKQEKKEEKKANKEGQEQEGQEQGEKKTTLFVKISNAARRSNDEYEARRNSRQEDVRVREEENKKDANAVDLESIDMNKDNQELE